jgi:hypothetical protein
VEFSVRAFNMINHPQYTGGYLDDVALAPGGGQGSSIGDLEWSALEPNSSLFQQYRQRFRAIRAAVAVDYEVDFLASSEGWDIVA